MAGKRKRKRRRQSSMLLALGGPKTKQMKGRDKTMLQKRTEYRQEVNSE